MMSRIYSAGLQFTLLVAMVGLLSVSCYREDATATSPKSIYASKIINSSAEAFGGELLIYVDEATAEAFDTSGDTTRSGIATVDAHLTKLGVISVEHAIDMKCDVERRKAFGLHRWFKVRFASDTDVDGAAMQMASLDGVMRVQFCTPVEAPRTTFAKVGSQGVTRSAEYPFNDEKLPLQWDYHNVGESSLFPAAKAGADINLYDAWELTTGDPEIIVAVVDEAIDTAHEDIAANLMVNEAELNGEAGVDDDGNGYVDDIHGYNFADNGMLSIKEKDTGHATHVAGTLAAVNNNGIGVSGVAGGDGSGNGVRLLSCQIFSDGKEPSVDQVANAILYAADNGASILQNSWSFVSGSPGLANDGQFKVTLKLEYEAMNYFRTKSNCRAMEGGLIIFAAGNDGAPAAGYPGAYREYISVTAFAPDGLPAWYTNYDKGCNISAPGGEILTDNEAGGILSTMPNNSYGYAEGSSMACPHVSGIAALALSYALKHNIHLTADQYNGILLSSVNDINASLTGARFTPKGNKMDLDDYRGKMGTGMIDAFRVLMGVRGIGCIPVIAGEDCTINLNRFIGDGSCGVKVQRNLTISDEVAQKLGIEESPRITTDGLLQIRCNRTGSAIITIGFIAGGDRQGSDGDMGGMAFERDFALVVRPANDMGGWL